MLIEAISSILNPPHDHHHYHYLKNIIIIIINVLGECHRSHRLSIWNHRHDQHHHDHQLVSGIIFFIVS